MDGPRLRWWNKLASTHSAGNFNFNFSHVFFLCSGLMPLQGSVQLNSWDLFISRKKKINLAKAATKKYSYPHILQYPTPHSSDLTAVKQTWIFITNILNTETTTTAGSELLVGYANYKWEIMPPSGLSMGACLWTYSGNNKTKSVWSPSLMTWQSVNF